MMQHPHLKFDPLDNDDIIRPHDNKKWETLQITETCWPVVAPLKFGYG